PLSSLLAHFCLEMGELRLHPFLHPTPLGLGPEQLALEVGLRPDPPRRLYFTPGCAETCFSFRPVRRAVLSCHLLQLTLRERQLVPLNLELPGEHDDSFAVPRG